MAVSLKRLRRYMLQLGAESCTTDLNSCKLVGAPWPRQQIDTRLRTDAASRCLDSAESAGLQVHGALSSRLVGPCNKFATKEVRSLRLNGFAGDEAHLLDGWMGCSKRVYVCTAVETFSYEA